MTSVSNRGSVNKTYCSVPECHTEGTKNPTVSFHRFPSDVKQRLKWKYATRIGKQISNRMCVCSKHFQRNDYFYNGLNVKKKRLKRTAVPSLNLPVTATDIQENLPEMMQTVKARNMISDSRNHFINQRKNFTDNISTFVRDMDEETSKTKPDIVYLSVDISSGDYQSTDQEKHYSENIDIDFESTNSDLEGTQNDIVIDSNKEIGNSIQEMGVDFNHSTSMDSVPLNTEVLKQKLEEMTAQYVETCQRLKSCQERCKKYEKKITALEKVINNFKQITSVTDDS